MFLKCGKRPSKGKYHCVSDDDGGTGESDHHYHHTDGDCDEGDEQQYWHCCPTIHSSLAPVITFPNWPFMPLLSK